MSTSLFNPSKIGWPAGSSTAVQGANTVDNHHWHVVLVTLALAMALILQSTSHTASPSQASGQTDYYYLVLNAT